MVEALKFYARTPPQCRNRNEPDQPGNKNDWLAEISNDGGHIAREVLAKIQSANETKTTP